MINVKGVSLARYFKTLNILVPFILRISRAKQNAKLKGSNIVIITLIGIVCCVGIAWFEFAKIKDANVILHAKSPAFKAAKVTGFYNTERTAIGNLQVICNGSYYAGRVYWKA